MAHGSLLLSECLSSSAGTGREWDSVRGVLIWTAWDLHQIQSYSYVCFWWWFQRLPTSRRPFAYRRVIQRICDRQRVPARHLLSHTGYILSRVKDSSSQIDYFLVGPSGMRLQSTVTIPEIHHLNLFDRTRCKARYSHQCCRTSCSGLFREESHVWVCPPLKN